MTEQTTSPVEYRVEDRVAWVTINRPEARNALNQAVRTGLHGAFVAFEQDSDAAVMILTGAGGKAFSAGGDLKEMAENNLQVPPRDFIPIPGVTAEVSKPIIAAVNGDAFAGGFLLAQSADLCVMADHARFAISEVKVGRGAPWALPLPWLIPPRVAMELLLTGDPISAQRAYEIGFVNKVVPAAELTATAAEMAKRIAANAPLSVRAGKRTVQLLGEESARALRKEIYDLWDHVYLSQDAQEGPNAFRDKRAPRWVGA